jgi:hypothetical protein
MNIEHNLQPLSSLGLAVAGGREGGASGGLPPLTSAAARHGLKHFSASSCNLFQTDPALFVMEKLMGIRSPVGCAAHRGTAAEAGIAVGLMDPAKPLGECQELAVKEFDRLAALSTDPNRDKERAAVPNIVAQGLDALRPYGVPSHTQHKIEWQHPDLPLPFIGYVDFYFEQSGVIVDLKTQHRLASEVAVNHAKQISLYCAAISDNLEGRITYCTPAKHATYRVENMREHLSALVKVAQTIERFLSISDDPQALAQYVAPNYDSYFWNDTRARQAAFQIWGF